MDIRKVKKLMELLEESGMAEIEIKEGIIQFLHQIHQYHHAQIILQ
mgnify:CR=1 FL=1